MHWKKLWGISSQALEAGKTKEGTCHDLLLYLAGH